MYEQFEPRRNCCICHEDQPESRTLIALAGWVVCFDCWREIGRRPAATVGKEIHEGIEAIRRA